ncbi:chemotaxis protein [Snodgrassella sp. ESL0253]|uniref:chemotaxis protein n=1 Tax=Snodgrassella sp. ESL0253 TaxID=2705031 RepID=UPI001582CE62|nr:chemotaxis protein [Snodgrassella sp. ESL0253]NUE65751.1 chemotaxis protein [Snodgrassella sp. ESL0253]
MAIPFIIAGLVAAAAAVGGKKAYNGHQIKSEADEILKKAKSQFDQRKEHMDASSKISEEKFERLGKLELDIGESFNEFKIISNELLKQLKQDGNKDLKLSISKPKLEKIEEYTILTVEFLSTAIASGVTGVVTGFAVYSGVMAFAAASTGTPIVALSGAAASNATMAAIGGGSLASGGWGMAGGAMFLGAAAIAPTFAIGGYAYENYAEKALKKATKTTREINDAIIKMDLCEQHLANINNYVDRIYSLLDSLNQTFNTYFHALKEMHEKIVILGGGRASSDVSQESLRIINNGYLMAAIMTDIITTPIFKPKNVAEDGVVEIEKDRDGFNVLNKEEIDNILATKEGEYREFNSKA